MDGIGYENHVCHFCHKKLAGYQRREDKGTKQYFDACESCARKPYKSEEANGNTKHGTDEAPGPQHPASS